MKNNTNDEYSRLKELSKSDFEISHGQADIRNWEVTNDRKKTLGIVDDLLYDTHSNKVRYFVVSLNREQSNLKTRKMAIPIGLAELHETEDCIVLHEATIQKLYSLPDYHTAATMNPGVENMIRHALSDTDFHAGLTNNDSFMHELDFYAHGHFNEKRLYQRRHVAAPLKTVTGIFDDGMEAENTVLQLIDTGFNQSAIAVSGGKLAETVADIQVTREDSVPIQCGAVVTIQVESHEEVLQASKIMDENGAIEVK